MPLFYARVASATGPESAQVAAFVQMGALFCGRDERRLGPGQ